MRPRSRPFRLGLATERFADRFFIWMLALTAGAFVRADDSSRLRIDPHAYGGPRGNEPGAQLVVQALQDWDHTNASGDRPWRISLHAEGEVAGRRDVSFDLDRAWVRLPTPFGGSRSALYLGRIHPWDVSGSPEAHRPWGLVAQSQPQNRGVLLGYGFNPAEDVPSPILLGWVGAHYWSDASRSSPFQWGVSATPLFVPNLGSEVILSENENLSVGRFARRPPGYVQVGGATLPVRYDVDRSRVFQDIVFQPQLAAQAYWRPVSNLEGWLTVIRAPQPDPDVDAGGYVQVTPAGAQAIAQVRPRFPQRWVANLVHRFRFSRLPFSPALLVSLEASDGKLWGCEIGAETDYFALSVLNERSWGATTSLLDGTDARYTDWLAQADLKYPLSFVTFYAGTKTHFGQGDLWLRTGTRWPIGRRASLDLGGDAFAGGDNSYFGEWRTNNRVYIVFNWEIGA